MEYGEEGEGEGEGKGWEGVFRLGWEGGGKKEEWNVELIWDRGVCVEGED